MNPGDSLPPGLPNIFDPQTLIGSADPQQLLSAAAHFPGGAAGLAFALFWAPAGLPIAYMFASLIPGVPAGILLAGIPAGVVLARVAGVNPAITFLLYLASDVLGAAISHPLYQGARLVVRRVPALQAFARRMMKVAMFGTRVPTAADINTTGRIAPALFRIGTVGFGIDVYTAGMLVAGLPIPRVVGWAAAIAGDMVWFAMILGISIATAAVVDDYRLQIFVVLIATLVLPRVAKKFIPALRDPEPLKVTAAPPAPAMGVEAVEPGLGADPSQQALVQTMVSRATVVTEPTEDPRRRERRGRDRGGRQGGARGRVGARARPRTLRA